MNENTSVSVREATLDDRREIWLWWNDPTTRKMMRQNADVPWEDHVKWYDAVLADRDRILCLGNIPEGKIGVIRFDLRAPEEYEVSINFNPEFRGRGLAVPFMEASIRFLLARRKVKKLWAGCKAINQPSKRTFERAGFVFRPNPAYDDIGELFCERFFD